MSQPLSLIFESALFQICDFLICESQPTGFLGWEKHNLKGMGSTFP